LSLVVRNNLADSVIKSIRQMILDGEVAPGEFLPSHQELAARFGVGLSTIREAMKALAMVGLVEVRPGRGTRVLPDALNTLIPPAELKARLGTIDARRIYEARAVIEVGLTELAAERATEEDIRKIWDALKTMEATVDDDGAFVQADLDFHLAVARAGRNDLLEQFYHLSHQLLSEAIKALVSIPGVKQEAIRLQTAIAEAIERHDPEAARAASERHMVYSADLLRVHWNEENGATD